jgi:hypothetical protein
METRVAILEKEVSELRPFRDVIHGMDVKLNRLIERENLEPRVRAIEDDRNKAVGGFKTLIFIGSLVGGVMGWLASKLFHT